MQPLRLRILRFLVSLSFLTGSGWSDIVINEIHYDPEIDNEPVEYVEIFNSGDEAVDLSGWYFSDGIDYTFPADTSLGAGGYVVLTENKTEYDRKFGSLFSNGVKAFGEFTSGKLSNDGELLVLRNATGEVRDEVDYGSRFPWPVGANGGGPSMELIHPSLDNDLSGSWRSSEAPSPGKVNTVYSETAPPQIRQVNHTPTAPEPGEPVNITAKGTDPDGVASMVLRYQLVVPGSYIQLTDEAYNTEWVELPMNDEGVDGDEVAGDFTYTAILAGELQKHRHLMRYQIVGEDSLGESVQVPYSEDAQPNFAYFTYGELPDWEGAATENSDKVTYTSELLQSVPVYHLITTRENHVEAQHLPGTSRSSGYTGSDYLWHGTLVYEGEVYDHIRFRARGGVWRYSMGKNMWKFAFNRGRSFQARDSYGEPYETDWRRLNFSAIIQQGDSRHRGEQGLFESVGFDLFRLADVPAPRTHYVHFRIIESATEANLFGSQFATDFQGLYLAVEQVDGRLLDSYDLPGGNIYKMEEGTGPAGIGGELNHQGGFPEVSDYSDLRAFKNQGYLSGNRDEAWWEANLDLESYYSYRSIVEGIHHYDIGYGKNYNYFHNPDDNRWSVIPWDLDLTWDNAMFGDGNEPFKSRVLTKPTFEQGYQNRLRELRDLLYNEEQTGLLIDEKAAMVYTPGEPSLVDADRAMWDYNPIMAGSTVNSSKTRKGLFYQVVPSRDFAGMIEKMKTYVRTRGQWIDDTLLDGQPIPDTPVVTYVGADDYPMSDLRFQSSSFRAPSPFTPQEFTAMKWRIAAVTDPEVPVVRGERVKYEIDSVWESEELTTFEPEITIPASVVEPDQLYRVRVKMKNQLGGWSHWSDPIQFTASAPDLSSLLDSLIISELLYAPAPASDEEVAAGFTAEDFEFIELMNRGESALDLTSVRFTDGIDFDFSSVDEPILEAGAFGLLVKNRAAFEMRYGGEHLVLGEYGDVDGGNRLDNAGERLTISYGPDMVIREIDYAPDNGWPELSEGQSLVWMEQGDLAAYGDRFLWRAGAVNGSPGAATDSVTFDEWKESVYDADELSDESISGWDADPDGVGFTNGQRYAFGRNAAESDAAISFSYRLEEGERVPYLDVRRRSDASDVRYSLEHSNDLENWISVGTGSADTANLQNSRMDGEINELSYRLINVDEARYWRFRGELITPP